MSRTPAVKKTNLKNKAGEKPIKRLVQLLLLDQVFHFIQLMIETITI